MVQFTASLTRGVVIALASFILASVGLWLSVLGFCIGLFLKVPHQDVLLPSRIQALTSPDKARPESNNLVLHCSIETALPKGSAGSESSSLAEAQIKPVNVVDNSQRPQTLPSELRSQCSSSARSFPIYSASPNFAEGGQSDPSSVAQTQGFMLRTDKDAHSPALKRWVSLEKPPSITSGTLCSRSSLRSLLAHKKRSNSLTSIDPAPAGATVNHFRFRCPKNHGMKSSMKIDKEARSKKRLDSTSPSRPRTQPYGAPFFLPTPDSVYAPISISATSVGASRRESPKAVAR